MEFVNPVLGLIFGSLALANLIYRRRRDSTPTLSYSRVKLFGQSPSRRNSLARKLPQILEVVILVLLAFSLARPRSGQRIQEILTPGVDIALTLDLSDSMRAEDMADEMRITAAKKVIEGFIDGREHDRIALIVFAAQAFTQCPLTLDYQLLKDLVENLKIGVVPEQQTAIGMGLITSIRRLKDSDAKSRVIILVTDGRSNTGRIDPSTAADMARTLGMKIYTIGVGGNGPARIKAFDQFTGQWVYGQTQSDIDEASLRKIADETGGQYYRATELESLKKIFEEISSLEKTEIKTKEYFLYTELFMFPLGLAIALIMIQMVLTNTIHRRIP